MATPSSPSSVRRPSLLRKLGIVAGILLVLLIVAYFVVTSATFLKGVILPSLTNSLGGAVTVTDASISPFSQVDLHGLKFESRGSEPLLTTGEVRLRYHLLSILRGNIKVDELTIASPVIQIIVNPDGTSNLDPLMKQAASKPTKPSAPATASKSPQLDIKNVSLKDATVRYIKKLPGGGSEMVELTGLTLTLDQLVNGQSSILTSAAAAKITRPASDLLEAKYSADLSFALGADLMPTTFKANIEEDVLKAEGTFTNLAGARAVFAGDVTATEIKQFSQSFYRGDQLLAELKVTGPLDLAKKEGTLKLEITPLDSKTLNLIGAPMGIDFGGTKISAAADVNLTQGGSLISVNTHFNANDLTVIENGRATPPLDLAVATEIMVNQSGKTLVVKALTLDGKQGGQQIISGNLAKPMTVAFGGAAAPAPDAAFELTVKNFNLADWQAFTGDSVSSGSLALDVKVASQKGGQELDLDVLSQIDNLEVKLGANPLTQGALKLQVAAQVSDFKKINLASYQLALTQAAQPALTISGSGDYDGAVFKLQTQIEAVAARLLGSGPETPLKIGTKLDGSFAKQVLDLHQLALDLPATANAANNEVTVTGQLDLSTFGLTKGHFSVKSAALDLTPLYNTFAGQPGTAKPAAQPAASSSSDSNAEPEPMNLPVQFVADVNLAQVWLRDIVITNCLVTAKVDGSKVTLNPCQLSLNGASVKATCDLDLGVKGYIYAVSLGMDKVPLGPIADSFAEPADAGKYQGLIIADAQIKGAGITGASLHKNLDGHANLTFTNANIQLTGPKVRSLVVPIARLLGLDSILNSPLQWLDAGFDFGGGNIKISRCVLDTAAFQGQVSGAIPIADVLTNSPLNLPVGFSLVRSLAQRINLVPANTPTNATYVAMPNFVTVKGTIGNPQSQVDKRALGGLLLNTGVGVAENIGGKIGTTATGAAKSFQNLLNGSKSSGTNSSTNKPSGFNPLNLFKRN